MCYSPLNYYNWSSIDGASKFGLTKDKFWGECNSASVNLSAWNRLFSFHCARSCCRIAGINIEANLQGRHEFFVSKDSYAQTKGVLKTKRHTWRIKGRTITFICKKINNLNFCLKKMTFYIYIYTGCPEKLPTQFEHK